MTMITPSYLGETIEYSSLHACRSTLEDPKEEQKSAKERLSENQAKIEQLRVDTSVVGSINVISEGDMPRSPIKDRRRVMALGGAGAGFLFGFGLIAVWGFTDRRLSRVADIASAGIDLPVLGMMPRLHRDQPASSLHAAQSLREMLTGLQIDPQLSTIRVFAVSSAAHGEGKTEMAAALALGFACLGKRTLLIDFDHRAAGLTRRLRPVLPISDEKIERKGLFDVLAGANLAGCCVPTLVEGVFFLPLGGATAVHPGVLTSALIRGVLEQAATLFEFVVLDTPPILDGLESTLICKEAESLLLVATPRTSDLVLSRVLAGLRSAQVIVGGLLFNHAKGADLRTATASSEVLQPFLPSPDGSYVDRLVIPQVTDN